MKTVNLKTIYNPRKSFYGKAKVVFQPEKETLESYGTPVATVARGKFRVSTAWDYSNTTLSHLEEFIRQSSISSQFRSEISKRTINKYLHKNYIVPVAPSKLITEPASLLAQ